MKNRYDKSEYANNKTDLALFLKNIPKNLFILFLGLLILMSFEGLSAVGPGQITVSGTVYDENNHPLPGVSILEKNTSNGTLSDGKGKYTLTLQTKDPVMLFSFIGYEGVEIRLEGRKVVDVYLMPADMELEEVVIVSCGTRASHELAGSVRGIVSRKSASYPASYDSYADMSYIQHNTEGYSTIHENGFKDVYAAPLSTFSVDVDKASYSNIRRFLNMGQLPPKDAVRIEEMINYFSYDYPEPEDEHPFSVSTELSICPWNPDHQLLHIGLKAKEMEKSQLPPSNLVFLLDVSGSMSDYNKLPLLKQSFRLLVNELRAEDRVAIVVYAGAAGLVLESTPGNEKEKILAALDKLQAGGSTAGGEGLKLAYKEASKNYMEKGNNRIILATDGDFNVGVSSNAEMERMVESERDRGIFITVLGFGMGNYKDDKMEIIADKGNGNYAYIDNIQEARKNMVSEFAGTLYTVARDVKFQLEFNPSRVKAYKLVGYENRLLNNEDFNDDKKDAGEIGAGHTVTALYEIIPAGSESKVPGVDPLKYQKDPSAVKIAPDPEAELLTIKLRYKKPDGNTSILVERPVRGEIVNLNNASDNLKFSAAVAGFGMILRESGYNKTMDTGSVIKLAESAEGKDPEGYRKEFIRMVKTSGSLGLLLKNQEEKPDQSIQITNRSDR